MSNSMNGSPRRRKKLRIPKFDPFSNYHQHIPILVKEPKPERKPKPVKANDPSGFLSSFFKMTTRNGVAGTPSSGPSAESSSQSAAAFTTATSAVTSATTTGQPIIHAAPMIWLNDLENDFDKAFVDLDLLLGEIDTDELNDTTNEIQQKMTSLSTCFTQLVQKAQTIFQNNSRCEKEISALRSELHSAQADKAKMERESRQLMTQVRNLQRQLQSEPVVSPSQHESDTNEKNLEQEIKDIVDDILPYERTQAELDFFAKEGAKTQNGAMSVTKELNHIVDEILPHERTQAELNFLAKEGGKLRNALSMPNEPVTIPVKMDRSSIGKGRKRNGFPPVMDEECNLVVAPKYACLFEKMGDKERSKLVTFGAEAVGESTGYGHRVEQKGSSHYKVLKKYA